LNIVILHKDFRINDNPALFYASLSRKYLIIYPYDSRYWVTNGYSNNQFNFTLECLKELNEKLGFINAKIHVFEGNLSKLKFWIERSHPECLIHINQSTDVFYYRELLFNFKKYFHKTERIKIYENFGIQIKNYNREIWSKNWFRIMTTATLNSPLENKVKITSTLPTLEQFSESLPKIILSNSSFQTGGESEAIKILESFIDSRVNGYSKKMSSPIEAEFSCSRLSPHISHGSISMRFIYQRLIAALEYSKYKKDLLSFKKRLHWHCHFIQKLQTEPEIEYKSMHPMCENLRSESNSELIEKWILGETGFPFLDACMIFLRKKGWINFRMRAMIMSFASYNLWQPWQKTSPLLAELFIDYEPGIHISQVQMQSGVTGINLPRIYSVIKQSKDQDPYAQFIKSQIPSLKQINTTKLHNAELSDYYIDQIVDLNASSKKARETIWSIRSSRQFKTLAKDVYSKHGSRFRRKQK
tara:strand:- start:191 stop:1606 length:1416 start_codon:yes stop_codon:yes gene_type:complete